ncbi:LPXTG cell wall anchor domain-containing protein [Microbacterium sp. P5_E9]
MNSWKPLASVTLAAALILAPMASMGAYADEVAPPDGVVEVNEAAEAVVDEAAPPQETVTAPAENPGTTEAAPDVAAPVEEAPAGEPVAAAVAEPLATAPVAAQADPQPDEKWVFVCKYVGKPGVDERLQTGNNPISVSVNSIKNWDGMTIPSPLFADAQGRSAVIAWDPDKGEGQNNEPSVNDCPPADGPDEVTPLWSYTPPTCDADGTLTFTDVVGVSWTAVSNGNGTTTYTAVAAEGYVLSAPVSFTALDGLDQLTGEQCGPDVYPVPALFNAEPDEPTCASPGTFATGFLGEPTEVFGDVALYEFENVFVTVDRSVDGEVTLTVEAMPGFTLDGLEEPKWDVNGDATSATRTIVLGDQRSGPEACPLVVVPAPAAPTFVDVCGTVNDEYTVPADTATVRYEVAEDGDTVTITAVLVSEADEFPAGAVTEWTFTFTDDACPAPAGGSTPPSAMLPATGGGDMMPWGIAAAVMLLAGATLVASRRLAQH